MIWSHVSYSLRTVRLVLSALAVGASLLALTLSALSAHAAITGCRSDPIIVVYGAIVNIVSVLNTDPTHIRELDYTVTVPKGALLGSVRLTVGLGFPEKVTYVVSAAQPWGSLHASASVVTCSSTPAFATGLQVTSLLTGQQASGMSSDHSLSEMQRLLPGSLLVLDSADPLITLDMTSRQGISVGTHV